MKFNDLEADFSAIDYLLFSSCSDRLSLPLGVLNKMLHLFVALPRPSI